MFVTVVAAVGGWFVRREVKRIDQGLANAVKRSELEQLRKDMDSRHAENRTTLGRIEGAVTGTHQRIDDLYKFLARENGKQ